MSASENVVIYGASSTIARSIARLLASRGCRLVLIGRNARKLEACKSDLEARGADEVFTFTADLLNFSTHDDLWSQANEALGSVQRVILCQGVLGNQSLAEKDFKTAETEFRINFLSFASVLTNISNQMETDGSGQIVIISSVAGDRGRASNYIYGTAKAALTCYASGLRNRLHRSGVNVLTVKPGLVESAMTDHLPKNLLFASSEKVAGDIVSAMDRRHNVCYTPSFWRIIMTAITLIPEFIFQRLKL